MEQPPELEEHLVRFQCVHSTRWSDEDNQGVVNNAVMMTMLEEARRVYFSQLDLMSDGRFPFLLAQTNIRFVKPTRGGKALLIQLRTTQLGTTSFTQSYCVRDRDTHEIVAQAQARLVCYDPQTQGKQAMTPEFRERLARFEGI